uniref:DEP domain-containing protein n=3 Tax=Photinus pyralis TaxID=7054 RepID=A0A1Y1KCF9_PHOPY
MAKSFRLIVHQKAFSEEDIIISPKDFPEAKEGDIVEIYYPQPEEENPRLLLQIKTFNVLQTKDTISIEQSIATSFGLPTYKDVNIRIVDPAEVALDSVELTFKDQYMGRSEMWRLKKSLTNTCVYMTKKLEFCGGAIRCQVHEMWSQGDRVACGVINNDTKIVFRSSTSMVYLFLQMSSEMWDFDIHGDLYFEKAVNGFLADLFQKWKKNGNNHEVTIVLFSRTFYDASSLEEFPEHMRECLQKDYRERYYEDFYRVAIQNERFDDWSGILVQLRRLFSGYLKIVLEYHSRPNITIPTATNSTAVQGNFLEVLNMSLNVFEKHYLDRSFDRTGQLSVVITPGVGIFEVDRELTNVTKQRVIDNGVGSDLVCVGEQPLHAVPLLKFHNKDSDMNIPDGYSMPHWINLSFYSTNKKIAYSNFIPRIKLPPTEENRQTTRSRDVHKGQSKLVDEEEYIHNSFFDYDAYDAQVFQLPVVQGPSSRHRTSTRYKKMTSGFLDAQEQVKNQRKLSDPDIHHSNESPCRSPAITIPPSTVSPVPSAALGNSDEKNGAAALEKDLSPPLRPIIGSAGSPPPAGIDSKEIRRCKALINPFDPSHVTIKLTSNRRRWTHIFPKGPTGVLIQQHHYQAVPTHQEYTLETSDDVPPDSPSNSGSLAQNNILTTALLEYLKKRPSYQSPTHNTSVRHGSKSLTLLWGATGEQEWTPAITTVNEVIIGVDWKSLTIPACLPITTDYFPDKRALQIDYVVSLYNLLPDDVNADFAQQRANYKKPLTTVEVFKELVSQRLAQGFQLILLPSPKEQYLTNSQTVSSTGSLMRKRATETELTETYHLSIGRIFHKISLTGNSITVTRYRPRHPYPPFNIHYRYRFQAPYHDTYEVSWVSFTTEKIENYNWNYLDHYICTRGDTDFVLVDALKFWRFKVYLLPTNNAATKRIIEGAKHCDIYTPLTNADYNQINEGFLKFIEVVVNKIKRPNATKKGRTSLSIPNSTGPLLQLRRHSMTIPSQKFENLGGCSSPFRERLGSNKLPERSRPRSGSKVLERGRNSPAVDVQQSDLPFNECDEGATLQQEPCLSSTATFAEILEAMKNPVTGVGFLSSQQNLPNCTFIAADAVNWLVAHMEGVCSNDKAVPIMEALRKDHLICHGSGDWSKQFVFGFFLFYIVNNGKDADPSPIGDLQSFENDWLEVEMRPPLNWGRTVSDNAVNVPNVYKKDEVGVPHFLCDDIDTNYLRGEVDNDCPAYKHMHVDIDVANKSDRVEWGHARYQSVFRPDQAYELRLEWLVASGSIVSELLMGWLRKAQPCGIQMIPIPHDPLALPYSVKSDPLRGPIFIPLNTNCLVKKNRSLFEEFKEDTWLDRMFLFQECIVARFGFLPCPVEPLNAREGTVVSQEHQYIHSTGTVFILVPSPVPRLRQRFTSVSQRRTGSRYPAHVDVIPSPREAYITRHVGGKNKDDYEMAKKMGFLWSWNHMISKRWRTNQAVDTNFQIRLLKDFREFCENKSDRLQSFWEESWEAKENACTRSP